jgi:glycerol-3-phosphate cytidylyltransferase
MTYFMSICYNALRPLGGRLFVGVSTDELKFSKKQRYPVYNQNDRMKIINALRCVNLCFEGESLDL